MRRYRVVIVLVLLSILIVSSCSERSSRSRPNVSRPPVQIGGLEIGGKEREYEKVVLWSESSSTRSGAALADQSFSGFADGTESETRDGLLENDHFSVVKDSVGSTGKSNSTSESEPNQWNISFSETGRRRVSNAPISGVGKEAENYKDQSKTKSIERIVLPDGNLTTSGKNVKSVRPENIVLSEEAIIQLGKDVQRAFEAVMSRGAPDRQK